MIITRGRILASIPKQLAWDRDVFIGDAVRDKTANAPSCGYRQDGCADIRPAAQWTNPTFSLPISQFIHGYFWEISGRRFFLNILTYDNDIAFYASMKVKFIIWFAINV